MAQHILFDLDGTLTDPKLGITKSYQYALSKMGILVEDLDAFLPFIGPPIRENFSFYGLSPAQVEEAVVHYREYYGETGMLENIRYPGIDHLLKGLQEKGYLLHIATSKATFFAEKILAHFSLLPYFSYIGGCELDGSRSEKAEVIADVMEKANIVVGEKAVMVGDRLHDILGAKANGMESIGVLYGYGSQEELEEAGADHIVATVEELGCLLAQLSEGEMG